MFERQLRVLAGISFVPDSYRRPALGTDIEKWVCLEDQRVKPLVEENALDLVFDATVLKISIVYRTNFGFQLELSFNCAGEIRITVYVFEIR